VVRELIADEPNYLGHGSNYAILAQEKLRHAPAGNKLVVAVRHGGVVDFAGAVAALAASHSNDLLRDDVIATIAKPNFLPVPPHTVDMFLHIYCADEQAARAAGQALARGLSGLARGAQAAAGIWRVTTHVVVAEDSAA
jgi:hypothetical protein